MKLEIHERLALLSLLPKEGDYAALMTIRRAKEMLSPSPEEMEFVEMKQTTTPDGKPQVSWSNEKAASAIKDCPIDEYTTNLFREKLSDMSHKKKLTEQYISVFEKFVAMYR